MKKTSKHLVSLEKLEYDLLAHEAKISKQTEQPKPKTLDEIFRIKIEPKNIMSPSSRNEQNLSTYTI